MYRRCVLLLLSPINGSLLLSQTVFLMEPHCTVFCTNFPSGAAIWYWIVLAVRVVFWGLEMSGTEESLSVDPRCSCFETESKRRL